VDGDGCRRAGIAHTVDVARRCEVADVADVMLAVAKEVKVGVEQLLVLDALDDGERAPGDVVVDAGGLPGPPDKPNDRERSVRLGVQRVADVLVGDPRRCAVVNTSGVGRCCRSCSATARAVSVPPRLSATASRTPCTSGLSRLVARIKVAVAVIPSGCSRATHTSNARFRLDP